MNALLIKDGHIIDPARGINGTGSILVAGGVISWIGMEGEQTPENVFDLLPAKGMVVCPGFIDLHCHLRQPGFEEKETIKTGTQAAAKGGFSTICCMPNTKPPLDNGYTLGYVRQEAERAGKVRVLPIGCITMGRRGRELAPMAELAELGVVGYSDDGDSVMNLVLMLQALRNTLETGLPVIEHCEHKELVNEGVMNLGAVSASLGLKGIPSAAEEIIVERDISLARLTGGRLHIAHASTAGTVELIRQAKKAGINITAEVTPHHLTLTEDIITVSNTNAKVNPPLRTQKDVDVLINGLNEGIIDIIATDHAPHTSAEKQRRFDEAPFGISGFETSLGALMGLVHSGRISLETLIAALTSKPAEIIKNSHPGLGALETGKPADITIFDPDKEWTVDTGEFLSRGKNSPYNGSTLKGRVMATITAGELVYKDTSLKINENAGQVG